MGGQDVRSPAEQVGCRPEIAGRQRSATSRSQTRAGQRGDALGVAGVAQLAAIGGGLLEVIAEDLLVLGEAPAARAFEPAGEALVELRARALGQPGIGRVAHEDVPEAVGVLGRERACLGHDHPLAHERAQTGCNGRRAISAHSSRTAPDQNTWPTTEARCATSRSASSSWSRRAASSAWIVGGIASAHVGRGLPVPIATHDEAVVDEHAHELLDEQRVALGGGEDAL